MEIVRHTTGKSKGRISVLHTIATMLPGEEWVVSREDVDLGYAQVCCCKYAQKTGIPFKVSSPACGDITIKRTDE